MHNFLILLAFFIVLPLADAQAERKIHQWLGWFPAHSEWNEYTGFNPYLENGTDPHPEQFKEKGGWTPATWVQQRKNGLDLVQGFYRADILKDQGVENDVAVVTVGPTFYRLGGQDKRRVMASLDHVYGITAQTRGGVMLLRDWHTRLQIGTYTQRGLILQ